MKDLTFNKIRIVTLITWAISFVYFIYVVKDYEGRYLSELPMTDKVYCWIFAFHTLALAEVIMLSARGIERTPRIIFFTLFNLIAFCLFRLFR